MSLFFFFSAPGYVRKAPDVLSLGLLQNPIWLHFLRVYTQLCHREEAVMQWSSLLY